MNGEGVIKRKPRGREVVGVRHLEILGGDEETERVVKYFKLAYCRGLIGDSCGAAVIDTRMDSLVDVAEFLLKYSDIWFFVIRPVFEGERDRGGIIPPQREELENPSGVYSVLCRRGSRNSGYHHQEKSFTRDGLIAWMKSLGTSPEESSGQFVSISPKVVQPIYT